MVIDPAGDSEKIYDTLSLLKVDLKYIYLTHCHADHIAGVNDLKVRTNAKVLIHRKEAENLQSPNVNLCFFIGAGDIKVEADARVDEADILHIGDIEFQVLYTPGHTNGGSSLYIEEHNIVFTGDTLFKGTYGRCDLPTGNEKEIKESIKNKLLVLPDNTMIYPGHGEASQIAEERLLYE